MVIIMIQKANQIYLFKINLRQYLVNLIALINQLLYLIFKIFQIIVLQECYEEINSIL